MPGPALPAVDNFVRATVRWDPDGPGPRAEVLVVGRFFTGAGGAIANRITTYDLGTNTWPALGSGLDRGAFAVATAPNGDVVLAGDFSRAGGQISSRRTPLSTSCPALVVTSGLGCSTVAVALPNLLGLDHERLTFLSGGRNHRRTDVCVNVLRDVIA